MNEDKSKESSKLQYMLLKSSLISNITLLRQEAALMWQIKDTVKTEDMMKFITNMGETRDRLSEIATQMLDKKDLKQFESLLEHSLTTYFKEFDLKTRKWIEKTI